MTIRALGPLLPTDIVQRFALVHDFSVLQMLTMATDLLDHAMPALSIGNAISDVHSVSFKPTALKPYAVNLVEQYPPPMAWIAGVAVLDRLGIRPPFNLHLIHTIIRNLDD